MRNNNSFKEGPGDAVLKNKTASQEHMYGEKMLCIQNDTVGDFLGGYVFN